MVATTLGKLSQHSIANKTFKSSAWSAGHLQSTIERLAAKHPGAELHIFQTSYHKGFKPSAGTHDFDGVFDVQIVGMPWSAAQQFLRSCGWAAWHRKKPDFDTEHIHMATIPPGLSGTPKAAAVKNAYAKLGIQVGTFIPRQIEDYFAHAFGLKNQHVPGSDRSWHPKDIAKTIYSPEDDDMTKEEMLQVLQSKEGQAAIAKAVIQSDLHGQKDLPKGTNGRMVGLSITGIYNMLLKISKKLDA